MLLQNVFAHGRQRADSSSVNQHQAYLQQDRGGLRCLGEKVLQPVLRDAFRQDAQQGEQPFGILRHAWAVDRQVQGNVDVQPALVVVGSQQLGPLGHPKIPEVGQVGLDLRPVGEEGQGERPAIHRLEEPAQVRIILELRACHCQESVSGWSGEERLKPDRFPPTRSKGALLTPEGDHQGEPGHGGELCQQRLDRRRLRPVGGLRVVDGQDQGALLQHVKKAGLALGALFQSQTSGDFSLQALPVRRAIAPHEEPALPVPGLHASVIQRRDYHGRLADARLAEDRDRWRRIGAKAVSQLANFTIPAEAVSQAREPRCFAHVHHDRERTRRSRGSETTEEWGQIAEFRPIREGEDSFLLRVLLPETVEASESRQSRKWRYSEPLNTFRDQSRSAWKFGSPRPSPQPTKSRVPVVRRACCRAWAWPSLKICSYDRIPRITDSGSSQ